MLVILETSENTFMTSNQIKAIGNLLSGYHSDLTYITNFHRYKHGEISKQDYLKKSEGTFKSFINDFRVARNVNKTKTEYLLALTYQWVKSKKQNNVDDFAKYLCAKGITHGKIMTSLSSKILFLNNPWEILPLDSLAKNALGMKRNMYTDYLPLVNHFKQEHKKIIIECMKGVAPHLSIIEKEFTPEMRDIKTVRLNRFIDKLLWTIGR